MDNLKIRMEVTQIYSIIGENKSMDFYANGIFERTKIMPNQCYLVNSKTNLFVKFPPETNINYINGATQIRSLKELGLTPKLSSREMEENTIFVNSAPKAIFELNPEQMLDTINKDNPNIIAINTYVPPPRTTDQNLGSIKITFVTRNMVNSAMAFGIRVLGCRMLPSDIKQGQYLTTPQCNFCQRYHNHNQCEKLLPTCPNCAQKHKRFQCTNKKGPFRCINCDGPHKATSNYCYVRQTKQTNQPINDIDQGSLICPFGRVLEEKEQYIPAPPPQSPAWTREFNPSERNPHPQNNAPGSIPTQSKIPPVSPLTSYYDCLRIALLFDPWYPVFLVLQPLFGLTPMEFPEEIIKMISVQETDVLTANHPTSEQIRKVASGFASSSSNHGGIPSDIHQGAPDRSQGAQNFSDNVQRPSVTSNNAKPLPQRPQRDRRPPLLETPMDPFQSKTPYSASGAIPKRVNNIEFWVSANDPSKMKPLISKTQPSTLGPHTSKAQPSKLDPPVYKLNPHTTKTSKSIPHPTMAQPSKLKSPKPQPPKPPKPVTQEINTSNSFAVLEDLELGDEAPHDYSQQQIINEANIPYSQGSDFFDSISSAEVDDPPEFEPENINIIERDCEHMLNSSIPADSESPQILPRIPPPLATSNSNSETGNMHSHTTAKKGDDQHNDNNKRESKVRDWSKFIPAEIPPFDKDRKTKFRNTIDHFESEVPHFLRERIPSSNRFSIDGDQVRRTVKSFNDLTDANLKTSQQLYKEVKEAAEHYTHVKRDYYKNTTNPLTIPLKKELQQSQQQTSQPPHKQAHFESKENITFNIGTDNTPSPKVKKHHYKHPTPPDATSLKQEEGNTDNDSPQLTQATETKTKRMLRSNSTIIN